ncbi:Transposon Ty3-I Gag-Pol polyprotein [Gossypium australe]|uniref:Transposon Ty3-I Gag-Pol polyprotein n=1 Tax=Gossypium australe TaxID=47621 RepID=A0A5B6X3X7_9ROSI|nr:Transposon Ty3-I Gag-Pol polyprotein [Gossypium australe]
MLKNFIAALDIRFQKIETKLEASTQELKDQIGKLAKQISERPQGRLPSNTETNPREQIQAIIAQDSEGLDKPNSKQKNVVEEDMVEVNNKPKSYKPRIPYPEAITKDDTEERFGKFLKLLKKLHINLSFLEALSQMPDFRKFLKKLLINKRKIDEESHLELEAVCSVMLQNKLPQKLKDPGSFTIPCLIGSLSIDNALADLGASINAMPYKMFKQLGLGKPKQTRMSIQLADKTVRIPRGIIEDVLVKIDKFVFPVDFVVLDMDEDNTIPLILGRPFLATARSKIDVDAGELKLCVGDETVTLQALDSARTTNNQGEKHNPDPRPCAKKEITHEEQGIQIDELEEWKTYLKEKLEIHEVESKPLYETDKFKNGDQVLLDKADPRMPPNPNTNKKIPFKVVNVFPYGTVEDEDPNNHLANFLEFCDTFKINGISDDAIRLQLFPFLLRNKAKQWLNSLPRGSITTWNK